MKPLPSLEQQLAFARAAFDCLSHEKPAHLGATYGLRLATLQVRIAMLEIKLRAEQESLAA